MSAELKRLKSISEIPEHLSEGEAAEFYATHDWSEVWDHLEPLDEPIDLAPNLRQQIRRRRETTEREGIEIVPQVSLPERAYVIARAHRQDGHFAASVPELGVSTQGETLDELRRNLRQVVDRSLAGGKHEEFSPPPSPTIWLVYEEAL
jgi:predicted RNase H-like HicB family nuclease